MKASRPNVLSIAGFDPSSGAGVTADIKTFEANYAYGLGVCSALTYQNDSEFDKVEWINSEKIIEQIKPVNRRIEYHFAKIGLIENLESLFKVVDYLSESVPGIKIIWDPILIASAGFSFHNNLTYSELRPLLQRLFLITPNYLEAEAIFEPESGLENSIEQKINEDKSLCNVLVKSFLMESDTVSDMLFLLNEKVLLKGEHFGGATKHGTGCVLSAAITANLANGHSLIEACRQAKKYTERFIQSNQTLLGYHSDI